MTILNADRWLYTQLTTDPQLATALGGRVYIDVAPLSTQYPLAVITQIVSRQVNNISAERVMDDELWQVTIWNKGRSYASIEQIADRVREVLHRASGTGVIAAQYESATRLSDPDGYKAIALEFRLYTQ